MKVRLTRDQIGELQAFEVDTLTPDAPAGKAEFVEALSHVSWKGGTIELEGEALRYAASPIGAFDNAADILHDQSRHAMARAFEARAEAAREVLKG